MTFHVTEQAYREARAAGLTEDTIHVVAGMARRGAKFTHRWANRRFEDFILEVDEGTVHSIQRWNPTTRVINPVPVGPHEAARFAKMFRPVAA